MNESPLIRQVTLDDLDRCYEIETVSYGGEEAASRDKIEKRIIEYPEGFIVLELNNRVVGFINSGATDKVDLSDEEFKELIGHDPRGKYVVIMSVAVHPDFQRQGFASKLMNSFTGRMKGLHKDSIFIICQENLVPMYQNLGFVYIAPSDSNHGGLRWHEMSLNLS